MQNSYSAFAAKPMADRAALCRMALAALLSQARYESVAQPALDVLHGVMDHFIDALLGRMRRATELYGGEAVDVGAVALEAAGTVCGGTDHLLEELVEYARETSRGRSTEEGALRDVFVERGLLPADGFSVAPAPRNLAQKVNPDTVCIIEDSIETTHDAAGPASGSFPDGITSVETDNVAVENEPEETVDELSHESKRPRRASRRGSTDTEAHHSQHPRRPFGK